MQLLHHNVETLDADLQLQHTRRKASEHRFEAIWQMVGHNLKVQKQIVRGRQAIQKKLQDAQRGVNAQIEGPVHKLEVTRSALVQVIQRRQKPIQIEGPGRLIKRA